MPPSDDPPPQPPAIGRVPVPTVQAIRPDLDPEIIFIANELKKLKDKTFFGTMTVHLEDGIAMRYTTESSERVPMKHLPPAGVLRVRSRGKDGGG